MAALHTMRNWMLKTDVILETSWEKTRHISTVRVIRKEARTCSPSLQTKAERDRWFLITPLLPLRRSLSAAPSLDLTCDRVEMRTPQVTRGSPAPLLLLLLTGLCTDGYKPVIIVHGIFDGPKQFVKLAGHITEVGPEPTCAKMFGKMCLTLGLLRFVIHYSRHSDRWWKKSSDLLL